MVRDQKRHWVSAEEDQERLSGKRFAKRFAALRAGPTGKKARLLLKFLAQPFGKLFHLFQSCVQVFGEEALPKLLQI